MKYFCLKLSLAMDQSTAAALRLLAGEKETEKMDELVHPRL